jgi:hypothetical protein
MFAELFGRSVFQLVGAGAGGVEHGQQRERLATHRPLDQLRLP